MDTQSDDGQDDQAVKSNFKLSQAIKACFMKIQEWRTRDRSDKKLKRLLKDVSSDQTKIYLKTVHPDIWNQLKIEAVNEGIKPQKVEKPQKPQKPAKPVTVYRYKNKPTVLGIVFRAAVFTTIGAVGHAYYPEIKENLPDPVKEFAESASAKTKILYEDLSKKTRRVWAVVVDEKLPEENIAGHVGDGPVALGFNQVVISDVKLRRIPSTLGNKELGIVKIDSCVIVTELTDANWVKIDLQNSSVSSDKGYIYKSRLAPLVGHQGTCTFDLAK